MSVYGFFDTETTGIIEPGVCQLGWSTWDTETNLKIVSVSYTNPEKTIETEAQLVHHISQKMVEDAPNIDLVAQAMNNDFARHNAITAVAHNAQYDIMALADHAPKIPVTCTYRLARHIWPTRQNYKLGVLALELNLIPGNRPLHDAGGDVEVTMHLFACLLEEMKKNPAWADINPWELADRPIDVLTMPFGKHKGTPLVELPTDYLRWALGNLHDMDADLRASMQKAQGHGQQGTFF